MGFTKVLKNDVNNSKYISERCENKYSSEKPLLLVQNFVPEFERFYESKTYWLNGQYSHSMGDHTDPLSLGVSGFEKVTFAYPKSEYNARIFNTYDDVPEKIDDALINKLKTMARKVLKAIP